MGRRHELTEAEWARLAPLLPRRQAGKPRKDDRLVINGILWKLATGAPGGVLPERSGPWQSVDTRYRRWRRAGMGGVSFLHIILFSSIGAIRSIGHQKP